MDVSTVRAQYADAIAATARLRSTALRDAFARVPREAFLGPGPWSLARFNGPNSAPTYERTPDDDPVRVYEDVPIAIDTARQLNNGQPGFLAACLDALDLVRGDRFLHVGCGTGYFTAIAAEVVGTTGAVLAYEVDAEIAARAAQNLHDRARVRVIHGDASDLAPASASAIFINAGATHVAKRWVDALDHGARMLVPLTKVTPPMPASIGLGRMLKLVREPERIAARFVSTVGIYHCAGARDALSDRALAASLAREDIDRVTTLRTDPHERCETCWLHMTANCLSM